jgi:PAS domain S-box-containing protein
MQGRHVVLSKLQPQYWTRAGSVLIVFAALTLLVTAFGAHRYSGPLSSALLILVLIALAIAIGLHVRFLLLARQEHRETASALDATEREYKSVFDNALDGILILDDRSVCLQANPAALTLLGTDHDELVGQSIERFFAGEDDFKAVWKRFLERSYDHSETRVSRGDGRIVFVEYTAKANFLPGRHVTVLRDISQRKQVEEQMARNLDMAEAARAEAEAFRKTTLALTQDLSMDYVLDALLQSLLELVPCESAQVILVETDTRLFLAREVQNCEPSLHLPRSLVTIDARDSRFLMEILATKKSLLITNTAQEEEWVDFKGFSHLRSWLCVPLVASQQVLGFLSLGDTHNQTFTHEHLRLAKSLAIPAAVAIQNARLYEQAEIFRVELERRLADLQQADEALEKARRGREPS